ncbi:hypothetical protein ACLOJK_018583, partial [Asimina triloba]
IHLVLVDRCDPALQSGEGPAVVNGFAVGSEGGWTPPDDAAAAGINNGDDTFEKDGGDKLAAGFFRICPIWIDHKNRRTTMLQLDLKTTPIGDGEDEVQPTRERMLSSMPAAAVLGGF